jgi:flagellar FliL protein
MEDGVSRKDPPQKGGAPDGRAKGSKRSRLPLFALLGLLLAGGGAGGAWYAGLLPIGGAEEHAGAAVPPTPPRSLLPMPDIVANLHASGRRPVYVKLRAQLEVAGEGRAEAAQAAMPRLLDLFNTFLRETRPEELRGSAGMHRLREELIARANIALPEGSVTDVLFVEIVVQ